MKRAEPPRNFVIARRACLRRELKRGELERLMTVLDVSLSDVAQECGTSEPVVWHWLRDTDPRPPFWQRLLVVLEQLQVLERLQESDR